MYNYSPLMIDTIITGIRKMLVAMLVVKILAVWFLASVVVTIGLIAPLCGFNDRKPTKDELERLEREKNERASLALI